MSDVTTPETVAALAAVSENAARRAVPAGEPVTLTYRNWRGEVAERAIIPRRVWFGSTDWHPEPQWLLTAWDVEKNAERDFALKDFGQPAAPAVKVQARDFIQDARSWPVLTQKYLRRWPDSKKSQHWRGKAVHIETENGVWRKGGCGYTYAGAPDAGIWIFEDAVKRIAHCGPEKRGAFILVPDDALAALEGGDA